MPKQILCFLLFLFCFVFLSVSQQDSIVKIKIKARCKCPIERRDSANGTSSINADLQFEKNLTAQDLECYGFKLMKDGFVIACITCSDSIPFNFFNLQPGKYHLVFFADGYRWQNNQINLKTDDIITDYFKVGLKQLPKYLQASIREKRKRRK